MSDSLATRCNFRTLNERLEHSSSVLTLDECSHVLPSMQKAATTAFTGPGV